MRSRRCLRRPDCALVRAQSADEALLGLLRHEFAAIVLDIRMPGMSGIELAHADQAAQADRSTCPILFLTAHLGRRRATCCAATGSAPSIT